MQGEAGAGGWDSQEVAVVSVGLLGPGVPFWWLFLAWVPLPGCGGQGWPWFVSWWFWLSWGWAMAFELRLEHLVGGEEGGLGSLFTASTESFRGVGG